MKAAVVTHDHQVNVTEKTAILAIKPALFLVMKGSG